MLAVSRGGASSMGDVDLEPLNRLPSMSRVRHLLGIIRGE